MYIEDKNNKSLLSIELFLKYHFIEHVVVTIYLLDSLFLLRNHA